MEYKILHRTKYKVGEGVHKRYLMFSISKDHQLPSEFEKTSQTIVLVVIRNKQCKAGQQESLRIPKHPSLAMVWICPPKIHVESWHQSDGTRWSLWKVIPLWQWISVFLYKRPQENSHSPLCHVRTQWKVCSAEESHHLTTLALGSQISSL